MTTPDTPPPLTATYDQFGSIDAEWHAGKAVHTLFRYLDARNYRGAAGLFAQEGTWQRMGKCLTGPGEIEAALAARPAALATRHLVTNLIITVDNDAAVAMYYITVFEDDAAGTGPARLAAPGAIFVAEDHLVAGRQGWRFVSRNPLLVFRKARDGN